MDFEGISGFLIGLMVAALIFLNSGHYVYISSDTIKECKQLCVDNEGLEKVYIDGECSCVNGAQFQGTEKVKDNE